MNGIPYQLTPAASKGNAFCWMTWESQLRLGASEVTKGRPLDNDSKAGSLRAAMETGPQTPATLARLADLDAPHLVAALLKHDIAAGRVVRRDGKYWLGRSI